MLAVRCGGGVGAGTQLTAQRTTAARSGHDRGIVLSAGTGVRELTLRVSFSRCSHPHRIGASFPWPVRCSPVPSPDTEERCVSNKRKNEAWEALKAEIADMFRPLLRNLAEICSLRRAYDLEDYQIGMLFGAFLGCVGCYQLWKTAPSVFVDTTLAFVFYKLSVVSSELHRRRESNSLITRLKFGTILIMVMKDIKKNYVRLDVIRSYGCIYRSSIYTTVANAF
ncbi:uncharacterized protein LOC100833007 isoform X2 [Brachypodium distachyon]|uniref:Uncharacterized protein n=1 Tax=Brachypodium distachyon TaxID=15368 RepID=A0A0Q3HBK1_BRADI|nr:uncharacterized protein LOC100833007 isoform X2 [Brachypodium distachyon]KQJ90826.1 hypothetical protein BRADI_4g34070v3 [Brachypodium distachyon]|eukprot:XP_010238314.1 uncharacterized protein LOC100833007 isoform X2 [Brachypodium distachyon]